MQTPDDGTKLSKREYEVLHDLCLGRTDKEVAAGLGLSLGTVRVYRKRFQAKLSTQGLVQSALVAWRMGQLDLDALADGALAKSVRRRQRLFDDED